MTLLTEQAETIAQSRYYLKNADGTLVEDDEALFKRVAKAIAAVEVEYGTLDKEIQEVTTAFPFRRLDLKGLRLKLPTVRLVALSKY